MKQRHVHLVYLSTGLSVFVWRPRVCKGLYAYDGFFPYSFDNTAFVSSLQTHRFEVALKLFFFLVKIFGNLAGEIIYRASVWAEIVPCLCIRETCALIYNNKNTMSDKENDDPVTVSQSAAEIEFYIIEVDLTGGKPWGFEYQQEDSKTEAGEAVKVLRVTQVSLTFCQRAFGQMFCCEKQTKCVPINSCNLFATWKL